jgi:Putative metallopeptidase family (DUF6782)
VAPSLRSCALTLVVALIALVEPAAAQRTGSAAALDALAGPLYQELAALKGMAAPGAPPPVLVKSREETRRFIEQELDRRYSTGQVEAERKGLVAWGLIPPDYDLRRLFIDLMEEQLAAYYDPRGKVMVLTERLPPEQQQIALIHELVHALQDREVSLEAFLAPRADAGDQILARQALIEGEAVALTLELFLKTQGAELASLPDLGPLRAMVSAGASGAALASAPRFLRDLLTFPYLEGLNFAFQFRKRQPWSAISALYRDPPRSTTQILNPDKRLVTREDPVLIRLPDLGAIAPGTKEVAADELGEFALGAALGLQLGEPAGRTAAGGWRGDHYRVWEDAGGRLLLVYLVAMDSERRARALAVSYASALETRRAALAGTRVSDPGGAILTWRDGERVFAVERRGAELLIVEQMPRGQLGAIREAIWRSRSERGAKP